MANSSVASQRAAAMAYPWRTYSERWVLGVVVVVTAVLLAWWRGSHLTIRDRARQSPTDTSTTVALRVLNENPDELPVDLIASYLDRYGIRSEAVRITTRETASGRTAWVSLTVSAAPILAALRARSAELPLVETAEVAMRRLADQLREMGWQVSTAQPVDAPDLLSAHGHLAGYRVDAHDGIEQAIAELRGLDALELWTVIEFTDRRGSAASELACAVRTADVPGTPLLRRLRAAPVVGRQRPNMNGRRNLLMRRK